MPRIAIVAFHVYPDAAVGAKRVSELASHLARSGWDVTVVTHNPHDTDPSRHLDGAIARVVVQQRLPIALRLIKLLKRTAPQRRVGAAQVSATAGDGQARATGSMRPIARLKWHYHRIVVAMDAMKKWSLKTLFVFARDRRLAQAQVVMSSGPPWSPVLAAALVALFSGRPLLVDLRDPWVERFTATAEYRGFRRRVDAIAESFCLRIAHTVTVTTAAFLASLAQQHPKCAHKMHLIRNGYDESMVISTPAPVGRLAILYAGTIYLGRNPLPLLQGIAGLLKSADVDRTRVRLTMVGYCDVWNGRKLVDIARELAIEDAVDVQPSVPGSRVRELTDQANVIVNFAQGHPEQAPAKLYEQLVSNRYGLLFAEAHSESASIASSIATIFRVDDSQEQVLAVLRHLYDELVVQARPPALAAAAVTHSRARGNQRFEQLLRAMLPDG